jgi:NOL1/NOP2/fmu family ribosome biogenesis protein
LWPHLTNTGGFFAVLLERTGGPEPRPAAPAGERLSSHAKILLNHFTTHYGLPENVFADLQLVHAGNRLRLLTRDHARPETPPPVVSGLTLTRDRADRPKLSTQAALTVGAQATRNVIDLDRGELDAYFEQDEWAVDGSRLKTCDGPGHVMIRHAGHPLGIAALRNRANVWIIDSLFPKGWG